MPDTEFLDSKDPDFDKSFDSRIVRSKIAKRDTDSGKFCLLSFCRKKKINELTNGREKSF